MAEGYDLEECLGSLSPASMEYSDWIQIGMALKHEGYGFDVWDSWSGQDAVRYKGNGAMRRKWDGFGGGSATPVTGGTIVQMAKDAGWRAPSQDGWDDAFGWDSAITCRDRVVDPSWVEASDVAEPDDWDPVSQATQYLEALFDAEENVGYVTEAWEKDGRWIPKNRGYYDRTAGQLIEELARKGNMEEVFGDPNPEAGAWVHFNPLDGAGVKNANVTEFRYALVESDNMSLGKQRAIMEELELPIAIMVHSGGKSIHAIVRVDASDYGEYQKRVEYLYKVCRDNGLDLDTQNKNPSRLSRLPGFERGGRRQFVVARGVGKASWDEWREWIEEQSDDLPDPESLAGVWGDLPELSPPLIDGVLRQGHKMMLGGPSKAGKSFALIELCVSIAEGVPWLGFGCAQGRVLYVNLELDRASCLHRFRDVYAAMGVEPANLANIEVWNLRGKSKPMDRLAPSLIRRALKTRPIAVVIDPIYKVITGDENSADQMAAFCNQFDRVATELGCAVVYCHHHSKGSQGSKRSMDRVSGSGVFARDPDALLDMIELEQTDALRRQQEDAAVCAAIELAMAEHGPEGWEDVVADDDRVVAKRFLEAARALLGREREKRVLDAVVAARAAAKARTAWRIEGTLREFPRFDPLNLWFDYPVHRTDKTGALSDVEPEGEAPPWKRNLAKKRTPEERKKERKAAFDEAFASCDTGAGVTVKDVAEYLGVTEKTVRNRAKEHGGYWMDEGAIGRKAAS